MRGTMYLKEVKRKTLQGKADHHFQYQSRAIKIFVDQFLHI